MFHNLYKLCALFVFYIVVSGCSLPSFSDFFSPGNNLDASVIEKGEKALVLFRADFSGGSSMETHWLNLSTGKAYQISSRFFARSEGADREYDMTVVEPGEYALTYASHGGFKTSAQAEISEPRSEMGQAVIRKDEQDGDNAYFYALINQGADTDGRPLIASFSVKGGDVVYIGNMTIEYTYANPDKLDAGYFSVQSVALDISNQRTRAKNSLLEVNPGLAEKMEYQPFKYGRLVRKD